MSGISFCNMSVRMETITLGGEACTVCPWLKTWWLSLDIVAVNHNVAIGMQISHC